MNLLHHSLAVGRTTQGAEGLPRRRWLVSEIEEMVAAGIFHDDERFELFEGEVVPMSPKGIYHERLKMRLARLWFARLRPELEMSSETDLHLNEDTLLEPDFIFFSAEIDLVDVRGESTLLAVEVADSSLQRDLGRKSRLYSRFGVKELWVIDARTLQTTRFSEPKSDGYGSKTTIGPEETLEAAFAPEIVVRLADLALGSATPKK